MLRDIDIFSSYLKNIHDGIIIPGHEDIDGVAARGLVNGRDPPAAGGIYRQYPHVPEIINHLYSAGNVHRGRWTLKMPSTGRDGYRKNILTPCKALRCENLLLSVTCRKRFLVQGLVQI